MTDDELNSSHLQTHTTFRWVHDESVLSGRYAIFLRDKWVLDILMTFFRVQTPGDVSWYGAITNDESVEKTGSDILFLCASYPTSWQDSFFLSIVFSLTRKFFNTALFFLFSSFFFLETKSTSFIQLAIAGILCRGLLVFDFQKRIRLIYLHVCCLCHRSHVPWIRLQRNQKKFRQYSLHNSFFVGILKSGRKKLYILARWKILTKDLRVFTHKLKNEKF